MAAVGVAGASIEAAAQAQPPQSAAITIVRPSPLQPSPDHATHPPSRLKGKPNASPTDPGTRGNRSRTGPVTTSVCEWAGRGRG